MILTCNMCKSVWRGKLVWFGSMVFEAISKNISAISWRPVLLVEETGEPAEKTPDLSQVTDKLYHIMLYTSNKITF
jgi:hypothetical protein